MRARGLKHDRRFMLVRKGGGFVSQRQFPKLAGINTHLINGGIKIQIPELGDFDISTPDTNKRIHVSLWRDNFACAFVDHAVNQALSEFIGEQIALVYMDEKTRRLADKKWAGSEYPVSFADGYPVLITNQASLGALNAHIVNQGHCPLTMDRFRPNIVIDFDIPWAENQWKTLKIGEVELKCVKPCARCVVTSIDQNTGLAKEKSALAALKILNPSKNPNNPGVIFGQNAVITKAGKIQNGQIVEIIR